MLGHIVYIFFVSTYLSSVSTPDINNQRFPISPQDNLQEARARWMQNWRSKLSWWRLVKNRQHTAN